MLICVSLEKRFFLRFVKPVKAGEKRTNKMNENIEEICV